MRGRYLEVRYEDLVTEPEAQLRRIGELIELDYPSIDFVIEVVSELKHRHRNDEARAFFDRAYARMKKEEIDLDPHNPESQNNLAWLCANCDERLDEALTLAQEAVRQFPQSYAYVDTLAETYFRLGHADKAVELETQALYLRPTDDFIQEQLAKFKKGLPTGQ